MNDEQTAADAEYEFRHDCVRRMREDLGLGDDTRITDAARVVWARTSAAAADTVLDAVARITIDEMPQRMREELYLARSAAANLRRHLDELVAAGQPAGVDDYLSDDGDDDDA